MSKISKSIVMEKKYKNVVCTKHDSVLEYVKYLKDGTTQPSFINNCSSESGSESFTGTESFAAAQKIMACGDYKSQELLERSGIRATRMKINSSMPRRSMIANVCGVMPHVPNYIACIPTAMIDVRMKRKPAAVINVAYNCSVSCGVGTEAIAQAAATAVSALLEIEASGCRINMYVVEVSEEDGQYGAAVVKIKNATQPFNTLKMAYPLCNPSMLRRHMFRWTEVTKGLKSSWANGYGFPIHSCTTCTEVLREQGMKIDVTLNYYSCNGKSKEDVKKIILDSVK